MLKADLSPAIPPPFDELPASAQRPRELNRQEILFHQNDTTRGLYLMLEGKIELQRYTENGDMVVIHRAKSGETFAEASLFSNAYHCDAVAILNTTLIEFDRQQVLRQFQTNPEFALALTRRFAGQIQHYRRKLEILAIKKAEERVFAAIVEGMMQSDIKTLSGEIGLTHEVVYRALARLTKLGRLEKIGRGQYEIVGSN